MRTHSIALFNNDRVLFNSTLIRKIMISLLFLFSVYLSQARELLDVPVKIDVDKGNIEGVTVSIIKNGIAATTIEGKKKMNLSLEFNRTYTLVFKKENYISKSIEFDTHVSAGRIEEGFEPYEMGVKLFRQNDNENIVVYNQAVAHVGFDKTLDAFSYETDYSKSVLSAYDEKEESNDNSDTDHNKEDQSYSGKTVSALDMNSIPSKSGMLTANPSDGKPLLATTADHNAGAEKTTAHNHFDKTTVTSFEIKERNRIILLTTVTKGDVSTQFRKVVYQWGGVYFFKDNTSSISEEVYALSTKVKTVE